MSNESAVQKYLFGVVEILDLNGDEEQVYRGFMRMLEQFNVRLRHEIYGHNEDSFWGVVLPFLKTRRQVLRAELKFKYNVSVYDKIAVGDIVVLSVLEANNADLYDVVLMVQALYALSAEESGEKDEAAIVSDIKEKLAKHDFAGLLELLIPINEDDYRMKLVYEDRLLSPINIDRYRYPNKPIENSLYDTVRSIIDVAKSDMVAAERALVRQLISWGQEGDYQAAAGVRKMMYEIEGSVELMKSKNVFLSVAKAVRHCNATSGIFSHTDAQTTFYGYLLRYIKNHDPESADQMINEILTDPSVSEKVATLVYNTRSMIAMIRGYDESEAVAYEELLKSDFILGFERRLDTAFFYECDDILGYLHEIARALGYPLVKSKLGSIVSKSPGYSKYIVNNSLTKTEPRPDKLDPNRLKREIAPLFDVSRLMDDFINTEDASPLSIMEYNSTKKMFKILVPDFLHKEE